MNPYKTNGRSQDESNIDFTLKWSRTSQHGTNNVKASQHGTNNVKACNWTTRSPLKSGATSGTQGMSDMEA
jgi:hypothetical protein